MRNVVTCSCALLTCVAVLWDPALARGGTPNDECPGAIALTSALTQSWNNTGATTGAVAQFWFFNCAPVPFSGIRNDVWYTWTSPVTGAVTITTQGTTFDTRLAVYPGSPCPPSSPPLACNDDASVNDTWSLVTFAAAAGQTYIIQVGSFFEGQTGLGVFNFLLPGACCNGTTCTITGALACTGTFTGSLTACQFPGNPVTCCPTNFNGVGGVDVNDIFAFIAAWFAQRGLTGPGHTADFNHDGVVDVTDIFAFIGAWFAGCP